jgi:cytochrome P450
MILRWFKHLQLRLILAQRSKRAMVRLAAKGCNIPFQLFDLFMLAKSGERKYLWRKYREKLGPVYPLGNAIMFTTFEEVEKVVNSNKQVRGPYVGGQPQIIPDHFCEDVLIFHSGERHEMLREFVGKVIENSMMRMDDSIERHIEWFFANYQVTDPNRRDTIAAGVGLILFDAIFAITDFDKNDIQAFKDYQALRLQVLFPRWISVLTLGHFTRKIKKIRKHLLHMVRAKGRIDFGKDHDRALILLIDMLMFAGVIGATHLVNAVLERMNHGMVPMNIRRFCIETARLDPSVSSFNTLNPRNRKIHVMGRDVVLPKGTFEMWSLSEANTDKYVFDNPDAFDENRNLEPVLSWNGTGVRACLGKHVSLQIVEAITRKAKERIMRHGLVPQPLAKTTGEPIKRSLYKWLYFPVVRQLVKNDNAEWTEYQPKLPQKVDLLPHIGPVFPDQYFLELKTMPEEGIELARSKTASFGIDALSKVLDKLVASVKPTGWFTSDAEVRSLFGNTKTSQIPLADINTEEGLLWYFLDSQGAILLERYGETGRYVCARSGLTSTLEVRKGCKPLNYMLIIDVVERRVVSLQLQGYETPLDPCACQEVLSHAWMQITLEHHFFGQHKLCAGGFAIALQQHLSPDHPVRRLLHRCCVGPLDILTKAYKILFLEENGSIFAYSGLTQDAIKDLERSMYNSYKPEMSGFREEFRDKCSFSPMLEDAQLYWDMWSEFVQDYLDVCYGSDGAIAGDPELQALMIALPRFVPGTDTWTFDQKAVHKMCTILLYASSAGHEIVGGLSSVMYGSPFVISPNIRDGYTLKDRMPNAYECIRAYGLALITTVRTFNVKQDMTYLGMTPEATQVLSTLQRRIAKIDKTIGARNKTRANKCVTLLSENVEGSIAA